MVEKICSFTVTIENCQGLKESLYIQTSVHFVGELVV